MNIISRTITGVLVVLFGLFLIIFGLFENLRALLIYGVFAIIIGFSILLNKKEDEIEEIKGCKN